MEPHIRQHLELILQSQRRLEARLDRLDLAAGVVGTEADVADREAGRIRATPAVGGGESSGRDTTPFATSRLFARASDRALSDVAAGARTRTLEPRASLFQPLDEDDALYVIAAGIFECGRSESDEPVLAGPGDVLGLADLVRGSVRSSFARTPTGGEVLELSRSTILRVFGENPDLFLSAGRRLLETDGTAVDVVYSNRRCLSGAFSEVALESLMRALLTSGAVGTVTLSDGSGAVRGRVTIGGGSVLGARFAHLRGREAVLQALQVLGDEGGFSFTGTEHDAMVVATGERVDEDGMGLLDEAVNARDELTRLDRTYAREFGGTLKVGARTLVWRSPSTREIAEVVWHGIKEGRSLDDIERRLPRSRGAVRKVVAEMLAWGILAG